MSWTSWEHISYIASILAAVAAVVGFPILFLQLQLANRERRDNAKQAEDQRKNDARLTTSQVLLLADLAFATHRSVNRRLRPGGAWYKCKVNPDGDYEWSLVEPYLGVFERMFAAYQAGQADAEMLDNMYGYRVANIWANERIATVKLQNERLKYDYRRLIALTFVLEAWRGRRFLNHADHYFPAELISQEELQEVKGAGESSRASRT